MGKEKLGVRLCTKRKHGRYGKKEKYIYMEIYLRNYWTGI